MKRILVPIIAAGLLLLAACSAPVISTPETRQLPLGQFNPPAELRGTWRLSPSTIAGKTQPPESLHFSETNIFLQPAAPGILEDLSVTWQDWIIKETSKETSTDYQYSVTASGIFLPDGKTRAHNGTIQITYGRGQLKLTRT